MSPTAAATPLLNLLRTRGVFARSPFTLVDAGCRGGIGSMWRRFAPHLVAHAFDPLVDECERLSHAELLETVHYHARYVGLPPDDPFVLRRQRDTASHPNRNPWSRLSAARAAELLSAVRRAWSRPDDIWPAAAGSCTLPPRLRGAVRTRGGGGA